MTVKRIRDRLISHNQIVSLWEQQYIQEDECNRNVELWHGMFWDVPTEFLKRKILWIFGVIPETIDQSDTINLLLEVKK